MGLNWKYVLQILRRRLVPLLVTFVVIAAAVCGGVLVGNRQRSLNVANYKAAVEEQKAAIDAYYATPTPQVTATPYIPEDVYAASAKLLITYITNVEDSETIKTIEGTTQDGDIDSTEVTIGKASTANPPRVSLSDASTAEQYARTFTAYIQTDDMLDRILASSGVAMDKVLLRESLRVESVDSTIIYRVIAYHADAQTATKLANAAAEALRTDAEDFFNFNYVMSLGDADEDALGASDIVPRPTPTPVPTPEPTPDPTPIPTLDPEDPLRGPIPQPSGPISKKVMVALACVLGLLAAGGVILVLEWMDKRIRDAQQVAASSRSSVLAVLRDTEDADDIRTLRSNLMAGEAAPRLIAFTQPMGAQDSRAVALRLAQVFAATGRKTLLIDASLRENWLAESLGLDIRHGLSSWIQDGEAPITTVEGGLDCMPAGPAVENPSDLWLSPILGDSLSSMRSRYELIILAAPAVLESPDTSALAPLCDGTLLVSRQGVTLRQDLQDAADMLRLAKAHILGNVFLSADKHPGKE